MSWRGPDLDDDERTLCSMLDSFALGRKDGLRDEPNIVGDVVGELGSLGVWTLGTAETVGGGGASRLMAAVAFERLGRFWPALGWASVQAHAAVDVLGGDERFRALVDELHSGDAAVAVVDAGSPRVHLTWERGALVGSVDRVDAAVVAPHLLLLSGETEALFVPASCMTVTPLDRTGLDGALTRTLDVVAPKESVQAVVGHGAAAARARLLLGIAAVAAGIAGGAADDALVYAENRYQFGDTLTAIPTVRHGLVDQAAQAVAALHLACSATADPVQAAAAARTACDVAVDVAAAALQSHGGYGYLTEYPAERRLRDAVSLRAAGDTWTAGTDSGRALVGLARATTLDVEAS